ncbi:MAG TPA: dihydrodipicolinate reductase C-terminal domain-containing protein [Vitreimonas sp.]|nr:dihydrodipicolinate reductase C-terminal domain-containing protein [Vitreimonas sp.]
MTNITILGGGRLGRAIEAALIEAGHPPPHVVRRPEAGRHDPAALGEPDVLVDASSGPAVVANVEAALAAGSRRLVLAATGWEAERGAVEQAIRTAAAAAVVAPNLSLGAAAFLRLVDRAAALLGALDGFDPYVVEWHRRGKRDRPSGTAREIVRRLGTEVEVASVRAGSSPGMHLVGFDSPGETIELHLTARDRSTYGAGALAAVDWLLREPRRPGLHPFDAIVDDLFTRPLAATA